MSIDDMTRRQVLVTAAAGLFGAAFRPQTSAAADDVKWLAEAQKPPTRIPREGIGTLQPLLIDEGGKTIRSLDDWKKRRQSLRDAWMKFLGPMPEKRPANNFKILREDRPVGCVRQLVRYQGEPGINVEGYLLRPTDIKSNEKRAGLIALHATTQFSIDQVAGVKGLESRHLGLKLCRKGFIVFCPRCFLWQNAASYQRAVADFKKRHPQTLGMHKMLYDAVRGVDILESLPDVDSKRIGAVGHSLGAKEALYLAAFDERIKAAAASEGGLGFRSTNWDASWYLGKAIHEPSFKLNHHQLLALIAPRPFLVLAGESGRGAADGDRSWPFIEAALPVYELYGKPPRLGIYNHREGHTISINTFNRIAEWLLTYLDARPNGPR